MLVVELMTSTYQAHSTHRLTLPHHVKETFSVRFFGKKIKCGSNNDNKI